MLTIEEIRAAVRKVGKKYGIKNAYLFGSYAKGEATEDSDVDILIDRGDIHTYRDYSRFWDELEEELGKGVDISSEDGMYPKIFELLKNSRVLLYEA